MQNNSGSSEANGTKPSLMSKPSFNSKPGENTQEPSILSSALKAQTTSAGAPSATKSSKFTVLAVGAIAIGAVYFGYQYLLSSQQPGKSNTKAAVIIDEKADEAFKTSPAAAAALPSTNKDTSVSVAVAAPEAAAQIINEPIPAKPAAASTENKITSALEAGVKPPPAALEKALVNPAPAKAPVQPAAVAKAPTANVVAGAATTKPAGAAATADKDVNLIAALLSHSTGAAPKAKPVTAPTANAQSGAPAAATAAAPTTAEPASASLDATTLALKQCGELSFLEREVCRVKTCNNQWETNAACKATMSTAIAKP